MTDPLRLRSSDTLDVQLSVCCAVTGAGCVAWMCGTEDDGMRVSLSSRGDDPLPAARCVRRANESAAGRSSRRERPESGIGRPWRCGPEWVRGLGRDRSGTTMRYLVPCLLLLVAACGGDTRPDAGLAGTDAGSDAGPRDVGPDAPDTGAVDSGGSIAPDSGLPPGWTYDCELVNRESCIDAIDGCIGGPLPPATSTFGGCLACGCPLPFKTWAPGAGFFQVCIGKVYGPCRPESAEPRCDTPLVCMSNAGFDWCGRVCSPGSGGVECHRVVADVCCGPAIDGLCGPGFAGCKDGDRPSESCGGRIDPTCPE